MLSTSSQLFSSNLDPRSDLKPADIAEEFDRMWEMWARGIPYSEGATKELGINNGDSDFSLSHGRDMMNISAFTFHCRA